MDWTYTILGWKPFNTIYNIYHIVKRYPDDVPLPNKLVVANKLDLFQTWKQDRKSNDENN